MKKIVYFGAAMLLMLGFTACHSDDPNTPEAPVVQIQSSSISGIVTDINGNPINNATVTINGNASVATDASGSFIFDDIKAGTYTLVCSADGMVDQTTTVEMKQSASTQNVIVSFMLKNEVVKTFNVTVNGGGEGEVTSEAMEGNDNAEIEIVVSVPENTVPENTTITISPVYTEESALISRAEESTMLIGADVVCSDPGLVLSQPIDVDFKVDATVKESVVTRMLINGQWVTVDHNVTDAGISVPTTTFGRIGLFFTVTTTRSNGSEALTFNPNEWNNLYGIRSMRVENAPFQYKVGSQYAVSGGTTLEALILEYLANILGARVTTVEAHYPLNATLPIGSAMTISGFQSYEQVDVTSNRRTLTGRKYGTVTVNVRTSVLTDHDGGAGGIN